MRRLDNLVKRQKEFGDLLLSSDIKEVPICGMSFGTVDLPKRTVSCTDNQFISVSSTRCNFTASIFIEKYKNSVLNIFSYKGRRGWKARQRIGLDVKSKNNTVQYNSHRGAIALETQGIHVGLG